MAWQNPSIRCKPVLAFVMACGFLVIAMSSAYYSWPGGWWLGVGPVTAFGGFVVALVLVDIWQREDPRATHPVCPTCGYDVTGLDDGAVCPECGMQLDPTTDEGVADR